MNKHEKRILTYFGRQGESKLRLRWIVALCSLPFLGMVAAFGTAPDTANAFIPARTVVESLDVARPEQSLDFNQVFWREERFGRGDTISDLLTRLGVNDAEARAFLRQVKRGRSLQSLRPGTTVQARTAGDGTLLALRFITDKSRLIGFDKLGAEFKAVEQQLALSPQQQMKSGEIRSSLFAAADAAGLSDNVAIQLADIFSGDIDFHRDLRRGDKFTVIYEMFYHEGRAFKSGRVLAAEFINQDKSYRAVWFEDAEGRGGYYTPDGKSVRKAFLRSPLAFSRISSGFAMRFHPILHKWRTHKGVDFAAPVGTHVKATADGTVEFAGWQNGYGKVVILKHQRGLSTRYAHLSRFAAGLRKGLRVQQGDVIGNVGQTGWATGPHLHYEFRVNNEVRNPLTVALPPALPIPAQQMAAFSKASAPFAAELNLLKNSNLALLE
ncbi:MAG: peptidoglycan DD-metalloendopeptidase family protein [Burkholderiales bacterium]|nr:peptidoglycan DD-metalloendopeptidase family protein [Burkholderiales bacterium]